MKNDFLDKHKNMFFFSKVKWLVTILLFGFQINAAPRVNAAFESRKI